MSRTFLTLWETCDSGAFSGLRWPRVAKGGVIAEHLRDFVRSRARPEGTHYARGNGTRLAQHLGVGSGWVTEYTDNPPTRHADIDQAVAICAFYGISLTDLQKRRIPAAVPAAPRDPLLLALEQALAAGASRPFAEASILALRETASGTIAAPSRGRGSARRR
ncbi:MAG: hypothetical protein RLZZ373_845 [Pseudomonadota bacterium]